MNRLFYAGLKSDIVSLKQKRSLFVLCAFLLFLVVLGGLLLQAPTMKASYPLAYEVASAPEQDWIAFLPVVTSPPLLVADFSSCDSTNNLGGIMGAAFIPPENQVIESYEDSCEGPSCDDKLLKDCMVRIEYHIKDWGAFWLKLEHANLSKLSKLIFDIKGVETVGIPEKIKIEIKRDCLEEGDGFVCDEIEIYHFEGTTGKWQRNVELKLSEFEPVDWPGFSGIQDWSDIEELVFTFEVLNSGPDGAIYLDNIRFGY